MKVCDLIQLLANLPEEAEVFVIDGFKAQSSIRVIPVMLLGARSDRVILDGQGEPFPGGHKGFVIECAENPL
jgi:hypothetical protein